MGKRIRNLAAALRDLEAAGCPTLLHERVDLGPQLRVSVGGNAESMVYDLGLGMACVIDLEIVNELSIPLYVRNIELRLPWGDDSRFRWLEGGDIVRGVYHVPELVLHYRPKETLNDWLTGKPRIGGKGFKAGWLLGIGGPIPGRYEHAFTRFDLTITDHLGRNWSSPLRLWVDGIKRPTMPEPREIPRAGLFEPVSARASGSRRGQAHS